MLIFRQLFDPPSSTYTYLLADEKSRDGVLIDPVFEQVRRDSALLTELGLNLQYTLETHVHADHVTGAWLLRQRTGSRIVVSAKSEADGADLRVAHGDKLTVGGRCLNVRATPGHTHGCVTFVLDDETMAFTGDCLLIRGCGRTDFQGGDAHALYQSVHGQVFTLPAACLLYPGHDYRGLSVTSVAEERRFNPRLGGETSEEDFVGYMHNLGLPHPKQIDIAVPANLKCGQPKEEGVQMRDSSWAPLTYTFAGICADSGEAAHPFRDDGARDSGMMPPGSAALLAGGFVALDLLPPSIFQSILLNFWLRLWRWICGQRGALSKLLSLLRSVISTAIKIVPAPILAIVSAAKNRRRD